MKFPDQIRRFIFEDQPIRGQHVSLDKSWRRMIEQSQAEGVALTLLGHALAATVLLAETLKIDGSISLQIRGTGAIHLLVVEATSQHTVRGIVRQSRALEDQTSLAEIFEADQLIITINQAKSKQHRGIVELTGNSIAEALQAYFVQSEQLPTQFWLACDDNTATGLLLQKMPKKDEDGDAWNRATLLAATTKRNELLQLPPEQLLNRLFNDTDLRLFYPDTLRFACGCSQERTRDMLVSLGKDEIDSMLEAEEQIEITCEFCNYQYRFDRVDLELLFNDNAPQALSSTQH